MPQTRVAEEVTVAGSQETISIGTTASTTYTSDLVNKLPIPRDLENSVLLSPGVNANGGWCHDPGARCTRALPRQRRRGQREPAASCLTSTSRTLCRSITTSTSGFGRACRFAGMSSTRSPSRAATISRLGTRQLRQRQGPQVPLTVSQEDKVNETYEARWAVTSSRIGCGSSPPGVIPQHHQREPTFTNVPYTHRGPHHMRASHLSRRPQSPVVASHMTRESKDGITVSPVHGLEASTTARSRCGAINHTGLTSSLFVEARPQRHHLPCEAAIPI
jgi:hypothetical protein